MTAESRQGDGSIRFLIAGACLVVIIAGLRAAAPIILPFLVAVFLAIVNVPLMNWLVRMRVPKPAAVLLTILTAVSIVGILVAVMAASMSTADSNLHALSAMATRDLYHPLKKNSSERERTWIGRLVIVLATVAAAAITFLGRDQKGLLDTITAFFFLAMAFSAQLQKDALLGRPLRSPSMESS